MCDTKNVYIPTPNNKSGAGARAATLYCSPHSHITQICHMLSQQTQTPRKQFQTYALYREKSELIKGIPYACIALVYHDLDQ